MSEVASALEVIRSQLAVLHGLCEDLPHRDLVGLLSELTSVIWRCRLWSIGRSIGSPARRNHAIWALRLGAMW
ncbi:MAG: hypothetical protein AB7G47_11105 [Mycolicibacterium sp.]